MYRGSHNAVGSKLIYEHTDSCYVRYGVHCAYFVEVDLINGFAVYMSFCLRYELINLVYIVLNLRGKGKSGYDMVYIVQGRMMVMPVLVVVMMFMIVMVVMFVVMFMIMMMLVFVIVVVFMIVVCILGNLFLAVYDHRHMSTLNAAFYSIFAPHFHIPDPKCIKAFYEIIGIG